MTDLVKKPRPKAVNGITVAMPTGCGKGYVQLGFVDDKLFEVFVTLGKPGECAKAQCEALTRSITLGLRCGVPVDEYIKQLSGIQCPNAAIEDGEKYLSCADGIAKILKEFGHKNNLA